MDYGDYNFEGIEYPMYVVVGGDYWVYCCGRLWKMELRGGVYSVECSMCGREYAVGGEVNWQSIGG